MGGPEDLRPRLAPPPQEQPRERSAIEAGARVGVMGCSGCLVFVLIAIVVFLAVLVLLFHN